MKLYLKNHAERYPVEQLQLQLFAQEPSEFCAEPFTGDGTVSSLSRGKRYLTATAKVTYQGKTGFASNRVLLEKADVRATRRILQRSYYLAALQVLPAAPPWGALSGVRPTKLSTKCLMAGGSERDAERLLRQTYFVSRRSGRGSASMPPGTRSRRQRSLTRMIFPCILGFRSARRAARTARL